MVSFAGEGPELLLPSPQIGDRERINLRFVYHRMMTGGIRSYLTGVPYTTLVLEFQHVNRPKIQEVVSFLLANAGKTVSYIDYDGLIRSGKLMNNPYEFVHTSIRNNSFSLTFEGSNILVS